MLLLWLLVAVASCLGVVVVVPMAKLLHRVVVVRMLLVVQGHVVVAAGWQVVGLHVVHGSIAGQLALLVLVLRVMVVLLPIPALRLNKLSLLVAVIWVVVWGGALVLVARCLGKLSSCR